MAIENILVDTSFLYAVYNQDDKRHKQAIAGIKQNLDMLIPEVVLVEAAYLFKERSGVLTAVKFLNGIVASQVQRVSLTNDDLKRASEIMLKYADAKFDFVDCCIMALSERLNITKVYTFDHRDFGMFRPKHCDYLELLPE
jgi:uncharacterized protein